MKYLKTTMLILVAASAAYLAFPSSAGAQDADSMFRRYSSEKDKSKRTAILNTIVTRGENAWINDFFTRAFDFEKDLELKMKLVAMAISRGRDSYKALLHMASLDNAKFSKLLLKRFAAVRKTPQFKDFAKFVLTQRHSSCDSARIVVMRVLGRGLSDWAVGLMLAALKSSKNPKVRAAAVRGLCFCVDGKVLKKLESRLRRGDDKIVEIEIVILFADLNTKKAAKAALRGLESKHPEVRAAVIDLILLRRSVKGAGKKVVPLLADGDASVRAAAVRFVQVYSDKDLIEQAIKMLRRLDGVEAAAMDESLEKLTGVEKSGYDGWSAWFKDNRKSFGITRAEGGQTMTGMNATYFGTRVEAKKIIFIIDKSESMKETYDPPEGVKRRSTRTSVRPDEEKEVDEGKKCKLDFARDELHACLGELPDDVKVNIIAYSTFTRSFKRKLEPVTRLFRCEALEFTDQLKPKGLTNVFGALALALKDDEVTCIYLLSDGEPTAGQFQKPGDIIQEVRKLNKRKVIIHTIGFGLRGIGKRLMVDLASDNGGRFIER